MTPYGAALHHQREQLSAQRETLDVQRAQAEAWQRTQDAKASLERTSKHALIWSAAGAVLCCAFAPSIVGIVMSLRARKLAMKYQLVLPLTATLGLFLGIAGIALGALLITIGVMENAKRDERIAAIELEIGTRAQSERLAQPVACLLAERRLLQGAFRGDKGADDFECDGRLELEGDRATLYGLRFESKSKPVVANACLERGERWTVVGFRLTLPCSEPDDTSVTTSSPQATAPQAATGAPAPSTTSSGSSTTP